MPPQKDQPSQNGIAKRALGRALVDLQNQGSPSGLLPAEDRLLAAVIKGERCSFLEEEALAALDRGLACVRADEKTCKSAPVRAEFLRFLALGGDAASPMHERGIEIAGAYVVGTLDL